VLVILAERMGVPGGAGASAHNLIIKRGTSSSFGEMSESLLSLYSSIASTSV
jgi:hypothetical protein